MNGLKSRSAIPRRGVAKNQRAPFVAAAHGRGASLFHCVQAYHEQVRPWRADVKRPGAGGGKGSGGRGSGASLLNRTFETEVGAAEAVDEALAEHGLPRSNAELLRKRKALEAAGWWEEEEEEDTKKKSKAAATPANKRRRELPAGCTEEEAEALRPGD